MTKRCKHKHVVTKYDCDGLPDPLELSFNECLDCGQWQGMGPSNDGDPRVAVEVRATQLVDDYIRDDGSWDGFVSLGMCSLDAGHASIIESDIALGRRSQRDLDEYYAGHLAAVIATHTDGDQ